MSTILNVIVIAAHPDEPEIYAGAISAAYAEMGHRVKFVTLTDGCCGNHEMSGQDLIDRRIREAHEAARHLGVLEYVVLPIPDGELMPTPDVRKEVIRQIRGWEADIVITFHPDGPAMWITEMPGRSCGMPQILWRMYLMPCPKYRH
ncbi:PIG-L deacetylase family protein [Bacillus sp. FSL K6-6540]|uniref:PIG-L deacetylase family protein n=1 Tax=Bacillus sp. FSL K6-6540 TaxID=2921512 RepID=UPI0030FC7EA7